MRKFIYNKSHLKKVETLINKGMKKTDAIREAGFKDSSSYYLTIKRLGYVERVIIERKHDYDIYEDANGDLSELKQVSQSQLKQGYEIKGNGIKRLVCRKNMDTEASFKFTGYYFEDEQ